MNRYVEYDAARYASSRSKHRTTNAHNSPYSGKVSHRRSVDPTSSSMHRTAAAPSSLYQGTSNSYAQYFAPSGSRVVKRRTRRKRRLAVAVLLVALALSGWNCVQSLPGSTFLSDVIAPKSTPVSEWRAGSMPYLYQTDTQWANGEYSGGSIGENGCGPTCLSMVYIYFTGSTDYGPLAMCGFAQRNGFDQDGATLWSFMSDGAEMLGLNSEELPADASQVISELKAGNPIICIMGPGDFTTTGHFIVLSGVDEDGRIIVHDPNSETRSKQTWDSETILSQCRCLWAYSM